MLSLINAFPFGNPAEKGFFLYSRVPQGALSGLSDSHFRKTVEYAYHRSPFYRRKFQALGLDPRRIKKPEDLGDFFTTPEDLRANVHEFVCAPYDTAYETTGTTSKRTKRVYFSRNEVREAGWAGAVGLWGLGVRPTDRVASAFDYSFWVSGPVLQASCETLKCFHVEAGRIDPREFYDRLSDYGITVIVGDPSWLVRLTEVAAEHGVWPVKLLVAGGENMTESTRAFVEKTWLAPLYLSYGQTEGFGALGLESHARQGYHLNEFHNRFEIVSSDAEGYGELVYTTLNRRVMPLIRYRSGDVTRFMAGTSPDGMPGRRIEKLKGRVDEWTVTAIGNIAPWMFEELFAADASVHAWQIAVSKNGNKDKIVFRLESADSGAGRRFLERFRASNAEAWRVREMGYVELEAETVASGALHEGRKLRRIVDLRKF